MNFMNSIAEPLSVLLAPIGPPLVLTLGSIVVWIIGLRSQKTGILGAVALLFWIIAVIQMVTLRLQPSEPIYSLPWQPFFSTGADLLWMSNGWNWYVSGLILLLGGVGLLLNGYGGQARGRPSEGADDALTLAMSLNMIASALLFTSSGNLLTVTLMWVVMDFFIIARNAVVPARQGEREEREEKRRVGAIRLHAMREHLQGVHPHLVPAHPNKWATVLNVAPSNSPRQQFQGLSMMGVLLLLIGLLPAGQSGAAEPLAGGQLPPETVILLLIAASIRAGVYPLHLWLLPHKEERPLKNGAWARKFRVSHDAPKGESRATAGRALRRARPSMGDDAARSDVELARMPNLPDRFIDHMIPALCGLWLLGWSSSLAREELLARPEFVALALLGLLGSAIAAYTSTTRQGHTTFVLITAVGIAGLTSILSETRGPAAVLWPTTTFALGGGLWLIGERIWRAWNWQIPISVGVLALVGVPFTPGFLTQSVVAQLLTSAIFGALMWPFFIAYLIIQMIYISSLLRSWEAGRQADAGRTRRERRENTRGQLPVASGQEIPLATGLGALVTAALTSTLSLLERRSESETARGEKPEQGAWIMGRLFVCGVGLAIPLVIAGVFPHMITAITNLTDAIPRGAGNPPSAVASWQAWFTLAGSLTLGIGLAILRSQMWPSFGPWSERISRFASLTWFSRITEWGTSRASHVWDVGLEIVEGSGYMGVSVAFVIIGYFLLSI